MASPWNQHCANCIDTLSFPIAPGHLQQARGGGAKRPDQRYLTTNKHK